MKLLLGSVLFVVGAIALVLLYCSKMPGRSAGSVAASMTEAERELSSRLNDDCFTLAHAIGHRSVLKADAVVKARDYLEKRLARCGLHPKEKSFSARGESGVNVEAEIEGTTAAYEVLVLGAHYDSASYTPGGDDNASGCAMLIEVAHALASQPRDRTIDVVFFDRGASRFAGTDASGSHAWVEEAKRGGKKVVAMLSLDSVGKFTDEPGSQGGPFPLSLCYPKQGNFLLFAGDFGSRDLVRSCVETFRGGAAFPCEGVTLPQITPGLSKSDHVAFWENGWPAVLVTDTGPLRNHEHGEMTDTPDRLSYDRMAKATVGLIKVAERLARKGTGGTSLMN